MLVGLVWGNLSMIKHIFVAAAAASLCAPAFAQAAPIGVELEGVIEQYDNPTKTLVVMGMAVQITTATVLRTPTTTRAETGMGVDPFIRGQVLPGRERGGFMDGTAIVIGTWDETARRIIADEITMEPSENVALGVITAAWCTTQNCDATTDYIRGNTKRNGSPGPAMLPIRDPRLKAGTVGDESGFAINLTGLNLNGIPYAAEGYYATLPSTVPSGEGTSTVSEKAFHYFLFDLVGYFPQVLQNKTVREANAFRAQCRVGKDFEVRGHVHTRVSTAGAVSDTIQPTSGTVQVQYTVNGVLQRFSAAATAVDVGSPIGIYRVRFTPPGNTCPSTINVRWLPAANSANTAAYASVIDYPVEIRAD